MKNNKITSILIVEDEILTSRSLSVQLENHGYEIAGELETFDKAVDFLSELEEEKLLPEVILIDIVLPGEKSGIDLANYISQKYNSSIIFITAYQQEEYFKRALESNPYAYISKPINIDQTIKAIEIAVRLNNSFSQQVETV